MTGEVTIIDPGFFSTIQDEGRIGFSKYGVPRSGAMDTTSYQFANSLLGNTPNVACIEWVFKPPTLEFNDTALICITGGEVDIFLNDQKVKMYHQIAVKKNDIITMSFCKKGVYGYVGIKDGFLSLKVLRSSSFLNPVTQTSSLKKNDKIAFSITDHVGKQFSSLSVTSSVDESKELKVFKGVEFDNLSKEQKSNLFSSQFTISKTLNRMAIQLEEKLPNILPVIITSPVLPGTVQLTPSGSLIVLMRDCQTTGGYPRVLQLSEDAINCIAQKRTGEKFRFRLAE